MPLGRRGWARCAAGVAGPRPRLLSLRVVFADRATVLVASRCVLLVGGPAAAAADVVAHGAWSGEGSVPTYTNSPVDSSMLLRGVLCTSWHSRRVRQIRFTSNASFLTPHTPYPSSLHSVLVPHAQGQPLASRSERVTHPPPKAKQTPRPMSYPLFYFLIVGRTLFPLLAPSPGIDDGEPVCCLLFTKASRSVACY